MGEQLHIPEVENELRRLGHLDEPLALVALGETVEV